MCVIWCDLWEIMIQCVDLGQGRMVRAAPAKLHHSHKDKLIGPLRNMPAQRKISVNFPRHPISQHENFMEKLFVILVILYL